MPREIRKLVSDLVNAGFEERRGKGSHRNYRHPLLAKAFTTWDRDGDDASGISSKRFCGTLRVGGMGHRVVSRSGRGRSANSRIARVCERSCCQDTPGRNRSIAVSPEKNMGCGKALP